MCIYYASHITTCFGSHELSSGEYQYNISFVRSVGSCQYSLKLGGSNCIFILIFVWDVFCGCFVVDGPVFIWMCCSTACAAMFVCDLFFICDTHPTGCTHPQLRLLVLCWQCLKVAWVSTSLRTLKGNVMHGYKPFSWRAMTACAHSCCCCSTGWNCIEGRTQTWMSTCGGYEGATQ
jgi:hypothetical protein